MIQKNENETDSLKNTGPAKFENETESHKNPATKNLSEIDTRKSLENKKWE
jgi:hypothetical protein